MTFYTFLKIGHNGCANLYNIPGLPAINKAIILGGYNSTVEIVSLDISNPPLPYASLPDINFPILLGASGNNLLLVKG